MDTAICCPKFDPSPWEEKTFVWNRKKFIKDRAFSLFSVELWYGYEKDT